MSQCNQRTIITKLLHGHNRSLHWLISSDVRGQGYSQYYVPSAVNSRLNVKHSDTRLNAFTRSCLFNASTVQSKFKIAIFQFLAPQNYSGPNPHLVWRRKLHFPRYHLVKVSWKSVQPFPRKVVSYLCTIHLQTNRLWYTWTLPRLSWELRYIQRRKTHDHNTTHSGENWLPSLTTLTLK